MFVKCNYVMKFNNILKIEPADSPLSSIPRPFNYLHPGVESDISPETFSANDNSRAIASKRKFPRGRNRIQRPPNSIPKNGFVSINLQENSSPSATKALVRFAKGFLSRSLYLSLRVPVSHEGEFIYARATSIRGTPPQEPGGRIKFALRHE